MNKQEHTPGPWTHRPASWGSGFFITPVSDKDSVIAKTYVHRDGANARLIAAAPDLLEALEFIMDRCQMIGVADWVKEGRKLARAAIAKAVKS